MNISEDEDFLEFIHVGGDGLRRNPRVFRTRTNHFEKWSDNEFFQRFRLTKDTVQTFLNEIDIPEASTKRYNARTKTEMLLLTLRLFAAGSMLIVVSDFSGVHRSTASRVIYKVSRAIASLRNRYIRFPDTDEDLSDVRLGFYRIAKFAKCVGALDCTHVKIQSPGGQNAETYRKRKGYFSINVQCICDHLMNIRSIVYRLPGSAHDSTIFNMSRVRAKFENGEMANNLLVGDSGYGIRSYLITPLRNPTTPAEHLFNESQIRTRNPIERCFRIWNRRFPVLALGVRLELRIVEAIIVATAVLHNIANSNSDPPPPLLDEELEVFINEMDNIEEIVEEPGHRNVNNVTREALINDHFSRLL